MVAVKANQESLKTLLNGHNFIYVRGQLIYKENENVLMTQISDEKNYTVDDYMRLPEGAPYQLINGKLIYMPSPFAIHQEISMNLSVELSIFTRANDLGKVYAAPFDVHFDKENVYQPDLLFIAKEKSHIVEKWVTGGVPDLVVEILSEGTALKDKTEKLATYGKYGVTEYWIVDVKNQTIEIMNNKNSLMQTTKTFQKNEILTSQLFEKLNLDLTKIFGANQSL